MEANQLFEQALGLGSGWKVIKSELDTANKQLRLELDFERGSQFACPKCGEYCPVHDTRKKRWRHLDFWQHRTELSARVPRICCEEHGVLQVEVPWGRAGSGFTLMMEAMILLLARQMSFQAAAAQLGESDHRVFRVAEHYVEEAWRAADWGNTRDRSVVIRCGGGCGSEMIDGMKRFSRPCRGGRVEDGGESVVPLVPRFTTGYHLGSLPGRQGNRAD